jgi:predicted lysophospholipase L1 biosynthesis ABC-type transport system permease subunit
MKNMPKIMANMPGLGGGQSESPTVKLSMREYEDMNIKVGDKVYFDIHKQNDDVNR